MISKNKDFSIPLLYSRNDWEKSIVMITLTFQNREGSIELFGEDESHHLMRECHLREADFSVGAVVDLL